MAHSILLWLEAQSYWVQILIGSDISPYTGMGDYSRPKLTKRSLLCIVAEIF